MAAQINIYGGSEAVEINRNASKPEIANGKILVKIQAAGVNPADWKMRSGYFKDAVPLTFPATLGGDFSGVVIETGGSKNDFKIGDEVFGQASALAGDSGTFAEFAAVNTDTVAIKPKILNHIEAAALPLAGGSAYQAIIDHINLKNGQRVLIHGGAGGIGSFAIQIAKHIGSIVATTAGEADVDYARKLGADIVIDYKNEKFEDVVKDYDAVFDTVGGDTYKRSFAALKKGGVIVSMLEKADENLMKKYGVKAISQFTDVTVARLQGLARLASEGALKINVDKIFPLERAADALAFLETSHTRGKVVVEIKR